MTLNELLQQIRQRLDPDPEIDYTEQRIRTVLDEIFRPPQSFTGKVVEQPKRIWCPHCSEHFVEINAKPDQEALISVEEPKQGWYLTVTCVCGGIFYVYEMMIENNITIKSSISKQQQQTSGPWWPEKNKRKR